MLLDTRPACLVACRKEAITFTMEIRWRRRLAIDG
jgi:hypothetical protein